MCVHHIYRSHRPPAFIIYCPLKHSQILSVLKTNNNLFPGSAFVLASWWHFHSKGDQRHSPAEHSETFHTATASLLSVGLLLPQESNKSINYHGWFTSLHSDFLQIYSGFKYVVNLLNKSLDWGKKNTQRNTEIFDQYQPLVISSKVCI